MAEAQHFYQAIGEVVGILVVAADGTKILDTGAEHYPAFVSGKIQHKYQDKSQGSLVCWRVYPTLRRQQLAFQAWFKNSQFWVTKQAKASH